MARMLPRDAEPAILILAMERFVAALGVPRLRGFCRPAA
jgi:hypothetical protein